VRVARRAHFGEVGVDALAVDDQRREQADVLPRVVAHELRGDALGALRLDRRRRSRAVLHAELHVEQAQEVVTSVVVPTVLLRPPRLVRCSIATVGGMP
jgi:hypothetical protein